MGLEESVSDDASEEEGGVLCSFSSLFIHIWIVESGENLFRFHSYSTLNKSQIAGKNIEVFTSNIDQFHILQWEPRPIDWRKSEK